MRDAPDNPSGWVSAMRDLSRRSFLGWTMGAAVLAGTGAAR
jgi:hypothetical protein